MRRYVCSILVVNESTYVGGDHASNCAKTVRLSSQSPEKSFIIVHGQVCSSTGLMANKKAIQETIKTTSGDHYQLALQLLEYTSFFCQNRLDISREAIVVCVAYCTSCAKPIVTKDATRLADT